MRVRLEEYIKVFLFVLSVVVVGAAVIDYGFELDAREASVMEHIYEVAWWCYFLMFTLWILFNRKGVEGIKAYMSWILALMLYLPVISKLFGISFFDSKLYNLPLVLLFALLEISRGVVGFIGKKTNPTLLLASGFLVLIFLGTLLLMLPRSTHDGIRLSVVDALFVSTSAVCVTGLSPVDISSTFTLGGQTVIVLLIQAGGLGVMTVTSFFALFFMGTPTLYSQFALKDIVGSDTFGSLLSTLLYILAFTFAIEAVGAILIWCTIHSTMEMPLAEEIFFAIFHSVSAFCNAGFSTLEGNLGNTGIITGHGGFFVTISLLVIMGGIGYPILVDLGRVAAYHFRRIYRRIFKRGQSNVRVIHLANINTRLVLVSTLILLVAGTLSIAVAEWNGAFAGMSVEDKLVHSFFNSAVPRTAGFNSVGITSFSTVTIIVYTLLMWIGGASQSTAGGVKVNTVAVSTANFISIIQGRERAVAFNREISPHSVRRASATIYSSIAMIALFFAILVIMEPHLSPGRLLFETVSAFSTVGASMDTTPLLGVGSKFCLCALMFAGRVGFITLLMGLAQGKGEPKYRYPQDNVIIN